MKNISLWILFLLSVHNPFHHAAATAPLMKLNQTLQLLNNPQTPSAPPAADADQILAEAHTLWSDHPDLIAHIFNGLPKITAANLAIANNMITLGLQLRQARVIYQFEGKYRTLSGALENVTSIIGATELNLATIKAQAQKILPAVSPEEAEGHHALDFDQLKAIATLLDLDISAVAYEIIDTVAEYGQKNPMPGATFPLKIEQIEINNQFVAKARGDGNCFYRSFLFSLTATAHILKNKAPLQQFITQLKTNFIALCKLPLTPEQKTLCLNYLDNQWKKLYDLDSNMPIEKLLQEVQFIFNHPLFDFLNIMYLRYEIAQYLTTHKDDALDAGLSIEAALGGSVDDYNNNVILAWGVDAQSIMFNIITKVFKINFITYDMNIEYLYVHSYENSAQPNASFVILKPGHYDAVITNPHRIPGEGTVIDFNNFWKMHSDLLTKIQADAVDHSSIDKDNLTLVQDAMILGQAMLGLGHVASLEIFTQLEALFALISNTDSLEIPLDAIKAGISALAEAYTSFLHSSGAGEGKSDDGTNEAT